jgi:hypothetical protein
MRAQLHMARLAAEPVAECKVLHVNQ